MISSNSVEHTVLRIYTARFLAFLWASTANAYRSLYANSVFSYTGKGKVFKFCLSTDETFAAFLMLKQSSSWGSSRNIIFRSRHVEFLTNNRWLFVSRSHFVGSFVLCRLYTTDALCV